MTTDEDKIKLAKLLQEIEIPEIKLTERCSNIVKNIKEKFEQEIVNEENTNIMTVQTYENPYKIDEMLTRDIDEKLKILRIEGKRTRKELATGIVLSGTDPKKPWRINSTKEKLIQIDHEIKRHNEKAYDMITPLTEGEMKELVNECRETHFNSAPIPICTLRSTVEAAKKSLPNFQYKNIENTTATTILPDAHQISNK
ncbi:hypothetical protein ACJJTC_000850 [Scirpophaga incertulas]